MRPKLLLLHGAMGSKVTFGASSAELNDFFDIYVMNFNGHGNTPKRPGHFNIRGFAEDVIAYLDEHKFDRIDIFGYSMGGYVALYLARHFPERVNKITTLGTKLNWTEAVANEEAAKINPVTIKEKAPKLVERLTYLHGEDRWEQICYDSAALLQELGAEASISEEDLKAIKHNVRICVGDHDQFVSIDESQKAFELLENGTFSVIPNTQHPFKQLHLRDLVFELRRAFKRIK